MAENIYRFEFVDGTQSKDQDGIVDVLGSGTSEGGEKKQASKKTFSQAFTQKASDNAIQQALISPLNTATGGLARPTYRFAKRMASGGNFSTAVGALAVVGIQLGLQALQQRVKELEVKTEKLNNTDNALIRAGSTSKATYYTSNVFGIKQRTNRS